MRPLPLNLLLTADAVGGVFTYALDLARGLAPLGVRTTLVMLGPAMAPHQQATARAVHDVQVVETGLPLDWLASTPDQILAAAEQVSSLAFAHHADLVHLNTPALALGDYPCPVTVGLHSCLASWWGTVEDGPLPQDFVWRTQLMAEALSRADAVLCPTHAFATSVLALYGASPVVVHNGRAAPRAPLPQIAPEATFAFSTGRLWDRGKNAHTLDAAAAQMDVPLLLAGPTVSPQGDAVRLGHAMALGALDEPAVRAHLARRPVFVSAALYEPFGLGVLEAAQAGCPLVLSDIPTFRELWHGAALFVPPRDAEGFAAAVNAVAADERLRRALGQAAERRAGAYDAQVMAAATADLYRALLLRSSTPLDPSSLTGTLA
ncbi:glycosyltransferase family 4 protein [Aquabacter sp. L1I39]|uniref:glycosyltransferase family 4 protein n=1 Tax=Aquabacter sp. L1I39 TaxID=2820278 RepID=UPI001ADC39CE|nr:glycosyltransferase family 4 protein [Aquabacter sp. L1I39]QTL02136.1 glycosyltransferase family 4 protein [Aquabacter sp. L1I39]